MKTNDKRRVRFLFISFLYLKKQVSDRRLSLQINLFRCHSIKSYFLSRREKLSNNLAGWSINVYSPKPTYHHEFVESILRTGILGNGVGTESGPSLSFDVIILKGFGGIVIFCPGDGPVKESLVVPEGDVNGAWSSIGKLSPHLI